MSLEHHLLLQEQRLLPSGEWSPRVEGWVVVRVAEGAGYWLDAGTARELSAGDMMVIAPNSRGFVRVSRLGPLELQFFVVQPRLLSGVLALAEEQQLESAAAGKAPAPALCWPAHEQLARQFAGLSSMPRRAGLPLRCRLLELWADAVAGLFHSREEEPEGAFKLRDRFRKLFNDLSQAEWAASSPRDLAARLACSERHFGRLFRKEFGVPFRTRQAELRLLRARQILAESDAKIIHVASQSGFRHLGLFNTLFKKRFGMTPSEWRLKAARKSARIMALAAGLIASLLGPGHTQAAAPESPLPGTVQKTPHLSPSCNSSALPPQPTAG